MTIEEAWLHMSPSLKREDAVFKLGWFQPSKEWFRSSLAKQMALFDTLNDNVLQALEQARQQGYLSPLVKLTLISKLNRELIGFRSFGTDTGAWGL